MAASGRCDVTKRVFKTKTEENRQNILENSVPKNTKSATKTWVTCFNQYLQHKEIANIIEEVTTDDLAKILYDFWSEVSPTEKGLQQRKKTQIKKEINSENEDEPRYSNSTLSCIRAGINRHLKTKRGVDMISDTRFTKANEMFKAVTKEGKKNGMGATRHKETY